MDIIDLFAGVNRLESGLYKNGSEANETSNNFIEIEEQRPGRNKDTQINRKYIESGVYKRKIDSISNDSDLARIIYKVAKEMLIHRSGTRYEDMYWIDLDTLKIIAKEIDCKQEKQIDYSKTTERAIAQYENILTIHTHPDSFPPSIDDINSNFNHNYSVGIVLGHNGNIFLYSANEEINVDYYKLIVEKHLKNGYNEHDSQVMALADLQKHFDINFKEVTDYGSI